MRSHAGAWEREKNYVTTYLGDVRQVKNITDLSLKTVSLDFFKGLRFWSGISGADPEKMYVVYAGAMDQKRGNGNLLSWKSFADTLPATS